MSNEYKLVFFFLKNEKQRAKIKYLTSFVLKIKKIQNMKAKF